MTTYDLQYIMNESGQPTSVIVPLKLWKEISSERETAYLLKSEKMRTRLLEAISRDDGIPLKEVRDELGI